MSGATIMTSTTKRLELVKRPNSTDFGCAIFVYDDTTLAFATETWRDLGEPTVITVTVEPGDKLNEEGA